MSDGPSRSGIGAGRSAFPSRAPQLGTALLHDQAREPSALARSLEAFPGVGPIARSMVAAHQRVAGVVEEVGVAEVEIVKLVAAGVEIGVDRPAIAHREGVSLDALDANAETKPL